MSNQIWLVEDEQAIADTLIYVLEQDGFSVRWFDRGETLLDALKKEQPDLMILDIGLPDINGFSLSKKIQTQKDIPFIFLTARSEEVDRIVGLEIGADDYIAKPFSPREVSARVRTVLRRVSRQAPPSGTKDLGAFVLNEDGASIAYHQVVLSLTRYEFLLLKTLILAPNRVFSRQQLMDLIWGSEDSIDRTVDTHIKTVRAKLKAIAPEQDPILTHRGLGYSLSIRK
ncbi:two-component system response regulator CreB [Neisseria sp. Ec49-e6-T10]|uniref:two-component system response regulator CreB n=1 Tax=Neisseria sp. Ec49-e6-T10 TaxID=3140744 RepID=UPI003EBFBEC4